MRINHNIAAMNTHRQLTVNQGATAKSLEKLSSGLKINRAGDDAAGLAISEKMRGQIRGLDQASNNANDAISLIKTAEGGLNETHSILQRMRELSVQSANATNETADRGEIQKEVSQLIEEITRIGNDTEFNKQKLLDGSFGKNMSAGGPGATDIKVVSTDAFEKKVMGVTAGKGGVGTVAITDADQIFASGAGITAAGDTFTVASGATAQDLVDKINATSTKVTAKISGTAIVLETVAKGTGNAVAASGTGDLSSAAKAEITSGTTAKVSGAAVTISGSHVTITEGSLSGTTFTIADGVSGAKVTIENKGEEKLMQIGANEGQTIGVGIKDMRATALGVDQIKVNTVSGASSAITTIDAAITQVSSARADLGAKQNRLEHTINNLGTASENASAAESRIRDVDMAKEMMEFTKNNILSQAAQSMLAQANQQPQGILQLLQ